MSEQEPERWTAVPEYEGRYEVSTEGRVRNLLTGRLLACSTNNQGYRRVGFYRNGQRKNMALHRLVVAAFIGPSDAPVVRHLDGDKLNNSLANLAYGTQRENVADAKRHGTFWRCPPKEECFKGHVMDEANTYRGKNGLRLGCLKCRHERAREWREKNRERFLATQLAGYYRRKQATS